MVEPSISVIVATRNRASCLKRMLDVLLSDDYPNREVVIADGASSDGTVALLESYGERITRWVSEPDGGEGAALNKALTMASGTIIKPMSDDDILRRGSLHRAAEHFAAHSNTDILFGQAVCWDTRRQPAVLVDNTVKMDPNSLSVRNLVRRIEPTPCSVTSFVRRTLFDRIGNFATDVVPVDVEFWARAVARGATVRILPEVLVDYSFTGNNGVLRRRLAIRRDLVRVAFRYGDWGDVAHAAKRLAIMLAARGLAVPFHAAGLHPMRWVRTRPSRRQR